MFPNCNLLFPSRYSTFQHICDASSDRWHIFNQVVYKYYVCHNVFVNVSLLLCVLLCLSNKYTVRYRYNAVNFFKNIHERHPIARPLGRGMGCLLLVQPLIDIMPQFLQWYMQYVDILDRVITALDCTYITWQEFVFSLHLIFFYRVLTLYELNYPAKT